MNSLKLVPVQRKTYPVIAQCSLTLNVYKDNVRSSEVTKQPPSPPSTSSKREQELLANIQLAEELTRLQASQSAPSQPVTEYLDNSRNQSNKDNVANQVVETKSPLNSVLVASDKEQKKLQADIKEVPALANQEPAKVLQHVPDREPELLKPHADIGEALVSPAPANQNAAATDKKHIKLIQSVEPSKISEKEPSKLMPIETKSPLNPVPVVVDREQMEPQEIIKETPVSPAPSNKDDPAATEKEPTKILEPQMAASISKAFPAAASKDEKHGEQVLAAKEDQSNVVYTTDKDPVAIKEVPVSPTATKKDDTASREKDSLNKDITNQSLAAKIVPDVPDKEPVELLKPQATREPIQASVDQSALSATLQPSLLISAKNQPGTKQAPLIQSFNQKLTYVPTNNTVPTRSVTKHATHWKCRGNNNWWRQYAGLYEIAPLSYLAIVIRVKNNRHAFTLLIEESRRFVLNGNELFWNNDENEQTHKLEFDNKADAKEFFECINFYLTQQSQNFNLTESLNGSFRIMSKVDELTQRIIEAYQINRSASVLKAIFWISQNGKWMKVYLNTFEIVQLDDLQAVIWAKDTQDQIIIRVAIEESRQFVCKERIIYWNSHTDKQQTRQLEFRSDIEALRFYLQLSVYMCNQRKKANQYDGVEKRATLWKISPMNNNLSKIYTGIYTIVPLNRSQAVIWSENDTDKMSNATLVHKSGHFSVSKNEFVFYKYDGVTKSKILEFESENDVNEFYECILKYVPDLRSRNNIIPTAPPQRNTREPPVAASQRRTVTDSNNYIKKEARYIRVKDNPWQDVYVGLFEVLPLPLMNNTKAAIYSSDKYGRTAFSLVIEERKGFVLEKEILLFDEKYGKPSKKLIFQNEADAKEFFECINFYCQLDKSRNEQTDDNVTIESLARYSFIPPTPVDELTRNLHARYSTNNLRASIRQSGTFWILEGDKWKIVHVGEFDVVEVNYCEGLIVSTSNNKIIMRLPIENNRNFICQFKQLFWNDLTQNKRSRKIEFVSENDATRFYLFTIKILRNQMDKISRNDPCINNTFSPHSTRKSASYCRLVVGYDKRYRWETEYQGAIFVSALNDFQGIVWCVDMTFVLSVFIEDYRKFSLFLQNKEILWDNRETKQSRKLVFRNEGDAKEFFECINFYLKKSNDHRAKVDKNSKPTPLKRVTAYHTSASQQRPK